jgi:hypothetical protein
MNLRQTVEAFYRTTGGPASHLFNLEVGIQRGRVASLRRKLLALQTRRAPVEQITRIQAEIAERTALAERLLRLRDTIDAANPGRTLGE